MNDMKFYDKVARKYIKHMKMKGTAAEQVFYDDLALFINVWRGKRGLRYEFVEGDEK